MRGPTYYGRNALRLSTEDWREGRELPFEAQVWALLIRMGLAEREWRSSAHRGVSDGWWYRLTEAGMRAKGAILTLDRRAVAPNTALHIPRL